MLEGYRRSVPYVGLLGLAAAVALRVQLAGDAGPRSEVAAVWFAAALAVVALATQTRTPASRIGIGAVGIGVAGAVVLCVPAAIRHAVLNAPASTADGYATWAVFVVVVAVAEEALLRGSLYRAVDERAGVAAAIAITSIAFGLLHAPVYGWGVVPLDIAVGVWLGTLRAISGTVTAPALAHSLADLAGWWLR